MSDNSNEPVERFRQAQEAIGPSGAMVFQGCYVINADGSRTPIPDCTVVWDGQGRSELRPGVPEYIAGDVMIGWTEPNRW